MQERNIAFIDAQNLNLGTQTENWIIDFERFRVYLKDKFKIKEAYFFLGAINDDYYKMYRKIQKAGFILEFREHNMSMLGKKKGNVDVDIVFDVMYQLIEEGDNFDKIVLVTGDGDYIKLIKYLIEKDRLKKILFPNKRFSSLYKPFKDKFGMNLSQKNIIEKLKYRN